jgi:hypothetical protein
MDDGPFAPRDVMTFKSTDRHEGRSLSARSPDSCNALNFEDLNTSTGPNGSDQVLFNGIEEVVGSILSGSTKQSLTNGISNEPRMLRDISVR